MSSSKKQTRYSNLATTSGVLPKIGILIPHNKYSITCLQHQDCIEWFTLKRGHGYQRLVVSHLFPCDSILCWDDILVDIWRGPSIFLYFLVIFWSDPLDLIG